MKNRLLIVLIIALLALASFIFVISIPTLTPTAHVTAGVQTTVGMVGGC